jgi:hypothetical protein
VVPRSGVLDHTLRLWPGHDAEGFRDEAETEIPQELAAVVN